MTEIISVRFKEGGKSYYFNPDGLKIQPGEQVIIETSRGVEFGECVEGNRLIDEIELVSPLRPVLRKATEEDVKAVAENKEKEKKAFDICQKKIQEHGLDMKLVEVEYNFDGSKILFFFTSDGRVDFRALVRDLASIFHTRIELRQIGVRDEAKLLGGLGVCGRPYCCNAFLDDFHPVSIKMAKTQNLSLNPTKISGACGRLMCCLKYEQEAYEDVLTRTPKLESLVETPDGVGVVNSVQLLREKVKVKLDDDPENPQVYSNSEIKVIRSGKGKRPEGYELPTEEERAERTRLRATAPAAPASAVAPQTEKKQAPKAERVECPRPENRPKAKPAPVEGAAPTEEGGEKNPRRRNRRHRKPAGEGGAVKAPQQQGGEKQPAQGKQPTQGKPSGQGRQAQPGKPRRERPAGGNGNNGKPQQQQPRKEGAEGGAKGGNNGKSRRRRPHRPNKPNGGTPPKAE